MLENSASAIASSHMSSIFQVNLVFFQACNFLLQLWRFNNNNHFGVLLFFYQVVLLKNVIRVLQCISVSLCGMPF